VSAIIFAALIAIVTVAHLRFKLNAILSFWAAYVLTRPLGASLGDYLSQAPDNNGLGLGPVLTSVIFLSEIVKFYGATGGINAGGFIDDNFLGTGGKPEGIVIENGKIKFSW